MTNFLNALNNIIWGPPLIILMIVTGVYFTLRTKFFQVRHLATSSAARWAAVPPHR